VTTVHETISRRVLIGPGSLAAVPDEVDRLGGARVLLLSTRSASRAAGTVGDALGGRVALSFDQPVAHTPVSVTHELLAELGPRGIDVIVAIGGGSAVGLSKAVAARTDVPQLVVPTTYAGSEQTPVLGETENGVKTTRRDLALVPGTVVYDPELTVSMPAGLTLTSALNAVAHAVEALWAQDATPVSDALATEAADLILGTLPQVLSDPVDVAPRARLQSGAWLAGLCLSQTQMGLHHQLAHTLGGMFDLPHAELHSLLLAHVMRFNLPYASRAADRLTRILGDDPAAVVEGLAHSHDGAVTLRELGVPRHGLELTAGRVVASPYPNPRPVEHDSLRVLLQTAWG
jgi:alcohol dehydrogenase class IV